MKYTKIILTAVMALGIISVTACGAETESEPQTDNSVQVAENVTENNTEAEIVEEVTDSAVMSDGETVDSETSAISDEEIVDSETAAMSDEGTEETVISEAETMPDEETGTEKKVLIAYFSNPQTEGTDADSSASRTIDSAGNVVGNVEYTASLIQNQIGGDLFRIETVQPYPAGYRDTTDQAKDEQNSDARPELVNHLDDVSQYETVYIGFPNWWGDMPMAVYSFFDEYDFSGANIHVFALHGGSGASGAVSSIRTLEPDATVSDNPLTIYWSEIPNAESLVADWLN